MKKTTSIVAENGTMPRRAYSYKRVSDPKQVKGDGLARQEDFATRICERNGWLLDDTLTFADKGRSGFHGDHRRGKGQLKKFLDLVKRRRITPGSVLIIENIDRLSREEVDEAHDLFKGLLKAGIWIATEMPERIYRAEDRNSLLSVLEPLLLMYLAHEASKKLSARISDQWERRREREREGERPEGEKAKRPGWIDWSPDGWILNPGRTHTVNVIFRLARRMGPGRIAELLRKRPDKHPAWGKGVWLRISVRRILKGREAVGERQPRKGRNGYRMQKDGDPIPRYWPAAVTEDEWAAAQVAIQARKGKTGRPGERESNLFTGLVREATSSESMSIKPILGGPKNARRVYRYLVCHRLGEWGRAGRGMAYQAFEDAVLRAIGRLRPRDVLPPSAALDEREARIADLTGRSVALHHRAGEIQAQIEDPENMAAVAALTKSLRKVLAESEAVAKELEVLKFQSVSGRAEALAEAQSLIDLLEEAKRQGAEREHEVRGLLKAAIGWLVDEIWVVVQRFNQMRYVVHGQIYLRAGARLPFKYGPEEGRPGEKVWDLHACDFRAGDLPADVIGAARVAVGA
jgi:DNA invertase Pin-like site-specific DNA recombinase